MKNHVYITTGTHGYFKLKVKMTHTHQHPCNFTNVISPPLSEGPFYFSVNVLKTLLQTSSHLLENNNSIVLISCLRVMACWNCKLHGRFPLRGKVKLIGCWVELPRRLQDRLLLLSSEERQGRAAASFRSVLNCYMYIWGDRRGVIKWKNR